jgi:hypothetical protein
MERPAKFATAASQFLEVPPPVYPRRVTASIALPPVPILSRSSARTREAFRAAAARGA